MKGLRDDRKLSIIETISRKINDISDYNRGLTDLLDILGDAVGAEKGWVMLHNYFSGSYFEDHTLPQTNDPIALEMLREIQHTKIAATKSVNSKPDCWSHIAVPVIRSGNMLAGLVFKCRTGGWFEKGTVRRLEDFIEFFSSHFESAVLEKVITQGFLSTIECLALALEAKDLYTVGHSNMVCAYSIAIATEMKLPSKAIDEIEVGSIMHDIGKIGIADSILLKETKLTNDEYERIKQHPVIGEQILMPLHRNLFETIRHIIRNHHERMDGNGYPDSLSGDDIPIETRIVMCADAFEAMTSNRPYREALPLDEAVEEIRRCGGTQFDPDVVDVLCSLMNPKPR